MWSSQRRPQQTTGRALKVVQPLNIVPSWGKVFGSLYSFIDQSLDKGCPQKRHDFGLRQLSSPEKLPMRVPSWNYLPTALSVAGDKPCSPGGGLGGTPVSTNEDVQVSGVIDSLALIPQGSSEYNLFQSVCQLKIRELGFYTSPPTCLAKDHPGSEKVGYRLPDTSGSACA